MKSHAKFLVAVLLLASAASAQTRPPITDEQQVRRIAEQYKRGFDQKNPASVAALYADDAYYVSQHLKTGIIQGRDAIRANIQRGIDGGGYIDSIEITRLEICGDFAYSVGTYHATNAGQKVTGRNILVFKKIKGSWFIVAHTSVVPE